MPLFEHERKGYGKSKARRRDTDDNYPAGIFGQYIESGSQNSDGKYHHVEEVGSTGKGRFGFGGLVSPNATLSPKGLGGYGMIL